MTPHDHARPSILFLSSSFLTRRERKAMRGVQLFDMLLTEQLLDAGVSLTVVAESTWERRLRERPALAGASIIRTPSLIKPLWNTLVAAPRILSRRYDAVILGNPTRGFTPILHALLRREPQPRFVLLAHRTLRPAFARILARARPTVVCVNGEIAADTRRLLPSARVETFYGVADADRYTPRTAPKPHGEPVRFGVIGKLDNPWKGAADAIEAFRSMPDDVRAHCRLILASYERPENKPRELPGALPGAGALSGAGAGVEALDWLDAAAMPDLLRSLDVLLVPSTSHETFSQAIVQGMLAGLPVIARDLPVLAEKLDAGGGVVVGGVSEMSAAMTRLATDGALRAEMGRAARATALERYVWRTDRFLADYVLNAGSGDDAGAGVGATGA